MNPRLLLGLHSGSSGDGVDAVLVEASGVGLEIQARLVQAVTQPYPRDLRDLLRQAAAGEARSIGLLHRILGESFAAAARHTAESAGCGLHQVQCAGCSGHTLALEAEGRFPYTLNVGMTAVVAERTGVTTLGDFQTRDLAAGGQGAPVTVLAEHLLFQHSVEDRILLHLGGCAHLTYLPAGGPLRDVQGLEVGPCQLFLDGLVRQLTGGREEFDPGGKYAVQGRCLEPLLERWLGMLPGARRASPGGWPFGHEAELIQLAVRLAREQGWPAHDLLCTATHLVARTLAAALRRLISDKRRPIRLLLSGRGVRNGFLWHLLEQQLPGLPLEKTDRAGVPADAVQAMGYALLAALTLDGVPASVPTATGAAGTRLLGSLTPGSAANWGQCLAWMAAQTAS